MHAGTIFNLNEMLVIPAPHEGDTCFRADLSAVFTYYEGKWQIFDLANSLDGIERALVRMEEHEVSKTSINN